MFWLPPKWWWEKIFCFASAGGAVARTDILSYLSHYLFQSKRKFDDSEYVGKILYSFDKQRFETINTFMPHSYCRLFHTFTGAGFGCCKNHRKCDEICWLLVTSKSTSRISASSGSSSTPLLYPAAYHLLIVIS